MKDSRRSACGEECRWRCVWEESRDIFVLWVVFPVEMLVVYWLGVNLVVFVVLFVDVRCSILNLWDGMRART